MSTSSSARWVVDAQAALQRGVASARADPKEPVAQGEATKAATEQAGEEVPRTSEAEVVEARASRASEFEVANAGAPRTTKAEVVEAGVAEPAAQDAEMEAGQALVPPPVQDLPPSQESAQEVEVQTISSDDTSRGKEVADVEAASTAEQPVPTPAEGSSALVRVQPKPHGWDSPRVLWQSWDDPEGEPLFALKDVDEGGTGAPSSNSANWWSGRCGQRCPLWPITCPVSPRYVLSSLVPRRLSSEFSRST